MIRATIALLFLITIAVPPFSGAAWAQQHDDLIFDPTTVEIVTKNKRRYKMRVQEARSLPQLTRGLMFRKELKPFAGMLFDFGTPTRANIWMKNTYIPLDIIFIDPDGTIESIAEGVPESEVIKSSRGPVRGVLELRRGTAKRLGIAPGDIVRHEIFGNTGKK